MELRKYERYESRNLVDYAILDEGGKEQSRALARTLDLSIDGLRLETREPLQGDTRLRFTLGLKNHLIQAEGVTVYCRSEERYRHISGLSFQKVEKSDRRKLESYLEQLQ